MLRHLLFDEGKFLSKEIFWWLWQQHVLTPDDARQQECGVLEYLIFIFYPI